MIPERATGVESDYIVTEQRHHPPHAVPSGNPVCDMCRAVRDARHMMATNNNRDPAKEQAK